MLLQHDISCISQWLVTNSVFAPQLQWHCTAQKLLELNHVVLLRDFLAMTTCYPNEQKKRGEIHSMP